MGFPSVKKASFLVLASLALWAYLLVFELRYHWYLSPHYSMLIRGTALMTVATIVILWAFFPSRGLVMLASVSGMLLPPIYDKNIFVKMDARFAVVVAFIVVLLFIATHLRRSILLSRQRSQ